MNESRISVRYSRALFQSAEAKKLTEKVYQDMIFITEICKVEEVKEVLMSPVIVPSKKKEILHKITEGRVQELTGSFISLVIRNRRERSLPAIAREFIRETKVRKGITESILTSAVKVDEKIRDQITGFISGLFKTKVELTEIVDKDIIGGFILRIEDNYIDASIKNKLRKIEKELKGHILSA